MLIRVRRASDSAEQDIGFDGAGLLDDVGTGYVLRGDERLYQNVVRPKRERERCDADDNGEPTEDLR
jgi:hypothetical protein